MVDYTITGTARPTAAMDAQAIAERARSNVAAIRIDIPAGVRLARLVSVDMVRRTYNAEFTYNDGRVELRTRDLPKDWEPNA